MNFISTFEELNKLYEETTVKADVSMEEGIFGKKPSHALIVKLDEPDNGYEWYALAVSSDVAKLKKAESEAHTSYQKHGIDTQTKIVDLKTAAKLTGDKKFTSVDNLDATELDEGDDWRSRPYYDQSQKDRGVIKPFQKPAGYSGSQTDWERKCKQNAELNKHRNPWEDLNEPASSTELTEADAEEEIEIVDDEMPEAPETTIEGGATEAPVEEDIRQVVLECDKCGALVIKPEADIIVDEESDLVNVEDKCAFCEDAEGFKIVGIVMPYETNDAEVITESFSVKYGRGSKSVDFNNLEDAVAHINDGMNAHSQTSFILYQDGKEMIWLDWYTSNRDGTESNWTEARSASASPVAFDKKAGKLTIKA